MRTDWEMATSWPTMIGPDEALRMVQCETPEGRPRSVPLAGACGRLLAEPVTADRDYPPFPRSLMDGYAVRTADAGKKVYIVGRVAAGQVLAARVPEGGAAEIMTGAPCPPGTEAVVPKEEIRREDGCVVLPETIRPGQFIASQGSECAARSIALRPGEAITPLAIAVMASFGREVVRVLPRPTMAIITTGAELVPPGEQPQMGQIRDSNGPMLAAMAADLGLERPSRLHAEDRIEAILKALKNFADRSIVLLTGGVSVGDFDLVPHALMSYGAEIVFHKVRQKPGKPLLFARKDSQLLFGLPGNPLSCHLCFHRYVAAAVRKLEGKPIANEPLTGRLTAPIGPRGSRPHFLTAQAKREDATGEWLVAPLPGASSADIFTACKANCYAEIPAGSQETTAGERVPFTWIGRGLCGDSQG